jgi:hypothetical protein
VETSRRATLETAAVLKMDSSLCRVPSPRGKVSVCITTTTSDGIRHEYSQHEADSAPKGLTRPVVCLDGRLVSTCKYIAKVDSLRLGHQDCQTRPQWSCTTGKASLCSVGSIDVWGAVPRSREWSRMKKRGVGFDFVLNNPAPASASCLPSAAQSSATGH